MGDPPEQNVMHMPKSLRISMGSRSTPHNLILKIVLPKNLVEHHLDVVAGVPVAVIVKAARLFQNAGEFHAARAHELDVCLGGFVAIIEGAFLLGLAPEDFIVAIGVEGRVDVDQVDRRRRAAS